MDSSDFRCNRGLAFAVLGSFIVFVTVVILRLGLGATPFTTTDSVGRPMGFNDRLSAEHYLIMVRNFPPGDLFEQKYAYEWLLAIAHIAGAGLLLAGKSISTRTIRWFFVVQAIVFPFGILASPLLPLMAFGFLTGSGADRESFVDVPFILMVTHPVWVLTSLYIAFALRGEELGLGGLLRAGRTRVWGFLSAVR